MDHYYIRSFDHMIAKMTRYADWGSAQMFIDGKSTTAIGIFSHTLGKFVRDYVINLGFLDGARGLISVGMHVYYTFLQVREALGAHRSSSAWASRFRCRNSTRRKADGSCRGKRRRSACHSRHPEPGMDCGRLARQPGRLPAGRC